MYELVADPNEVGNIPPYTGIVSILGTFGFCCTASICFFSSCFITPNSKSDRQWKLFLQASGGLILLLLIDDAFQVHENFSTLLFGVEANISETNRTLQNILEMIVFAVYGSLFAAYAFYFMKLICTTELLGLTIAFMFFGLSLIVDLLPETLTGHFILEEGFKLLGIVSLMAYYIKTCYRKLKDRLIN